MNGKFIREKIKNSGFQLVDIAKKLNITPQNLENKLKSKDIKVEFLLRIAESINKNVYYFLEESIEAKRIALSENELEQKFSQKSLQILEKSERDYGKTKEFEPKVCNACEEKEKVIESLEARLVDKDEMIIMKDKQTEAFQRMLANKDKQIESLEHQMADMKMNLDRMLSDKDRQIEDLKNNLERLIASKDEMLAMKEEAIKGREAMLAAKEKIISMQSKRISELESHNEAEDLKKILGTSERIGQENISLTDIHPKDLSTKSKKGEYKV